MRMGIRDRLDIGDRMGMSDRMDMSDRADRLSERTDCQSSGIGWMPAIPREAMGDER